MKNHDSLWINATLTVVTQKGMPETISPAAIACKDGLISYLCLMSDLPQNPDEMATQVIDVAGACITPGLIDCHTHLVFGGNRAEEFNWRLQGHSYAQIAKQGGGSMSTVSQTRSATEQVLENSARTRLDQLLADGLTNVEIK